INAPQLYFYSINDSVVSYLDVEKCIEMMRRKSIPVTPVSFDESKHCNHLSIHPMRYLASLYQHWETCLRAPRINSFVDGIFGSF
ncbi:hypothetical protein SAMD00019534_048000, partial [Acytostelium subglobosum LB1]|uniref:hypothetical protein n=1 Tax=Acytostelium subglobosum LB1 TaxID=1410327 RepID=UPI000644C7F3